MGKNMYNLKLHEVLEYEDEVLKRKVQIIRVPGGWLYLISGCTDIFVPYSNEFAEA